MTRLDGRTARWSAGTRTAAISSPAETACVRLLSLAGLLVFTAAPLWAVNEHQLIIKDGMMWLKALGLICAGVFVGAALIEAKQLLRNREKQRAAESEATAEAADAAEPPQPEAAH